MYSLGFPNLWPLCSAGTQESDKSVVCTQVVGIHVCICRDICIHLSSHSTDGCPSNHIPKGSLFLIFWSLWLRPQALVSPSSQYYMHTALCKHLSTQESTAPARCFQSALAHSQVNSRAIKTTEEKVLSFAKGWGGTGAIRLASHHISWEDKIQHPLTTEDSKCIFALIHILTVQSSFYNVRRNAREVFRKITK